MKKIGLVIMALVLVLGSMGFGYAMWSQTFTVTGQAATGSLSLKVSDPTCDVYFKDLSANANPVGFEWAGFQAVDATTGQPVFQANPNPSFPGLIPMLGTAFPIFPLPASAAYPNGNIAMVGWGAITGWVVNGDGSISVTAEWHNLFPWTYAIPSTGYGGFSNSMLDFYVTNTGTVPLVLNVANLSHTIIGNMPVEIGVANARGEFTPQGVHNVQIEPGQKVDIGFALLESEEMAQGFNGTLTFTLVATQWNESVS